MRLLGFLLLFASLTLALFTCDQGSTGTGNTCVVSTSRSLSSNETFGRLVVTNFSRLTLDGYVKILSTDVLVDFGSAISADGRGYGASAGPGAGVQDTSTSGGKSGCYGSGGGGYGGGGGVVEKKLNRAAGTMKAATRLARPLY